MNEATAIVNRFNSNNSPQKSVATFVYALQAASFLFGLTFLVAVIVNYIKKDDVKGTWLESHFRWQIRTFWYAMLWSIIGLIGSLIAIGWALLIGNFIWVIYRITKGWLRLNEGKEMYIQN